jgi:hypothetical protein
MPTWLFLSIGGLCIAIGASLLVWGRTRRVIARVSLTGAEAGRIVLDPSRGTRAGPHQLELRLWLAPLRGHRIFARLAAEGLDLPRVIQISDRPDRALGASDADPGPVGELRVVLTRIDRPLLPGTELGVELSPVPPTHLERAELELVKLS